LIKGLKESTKLMWSGDVDLADGSLQKQYKEYRERLKNAEVIALDRRNACTELEKILDDIKKDLKFLHSGIQSAKWRPYRQSVVGWVMLPCI